MCLCDETEMNRKEAQRQKTWETAGKTVQQQWRERTITTEKWAAVATAATVVATGTKGRYT